MGPSFKSEWAGAKFTDKIEICMYSIPIEYGINLKAIEMERK